ncbi:hypothetical protein CEXT_144801 [Caerostris extrusa]|uniref:Uncharacterized protein n=1 Tax=Caerostris extrusa TaxID=172846 RepID=A0AAV4X1I6_CAEEX|nr:hypothetical protein CEXT_144801 [Caerostris extrusa]
MNSGVTDQNKTHNKIMKIRQMKRGGKDGKERRKKKKKRKILDAMKGSSQNWGGRGGSRRRSLLHPPFHFPGSTFVSISDRAEKYRRQRSKKRRWMR